MMNKSKSFRIVKDYRAHGHWSSLIVLVEVFVSSRTVNSPIKKQRTTFESIKGFIYSLPLAPNPDLLQTSISISVNELKIDGLASNWRIAEANGQKQTFL